MAATIPTNVVTAMATATVAAPTTIEGQQAPLSMDLTGALRVVGAVSGAVTVTGGATAANQATMIAAIGAPADAAWSGTGDGTVISILKAIAVNTATP